MKNNEIYEKKEYELKYVYNLYEFFKYCHINGKKDDIRYLCFITDNQLIIGIGDDDYCLYHYDLSKSIQETIFPSRKYFKKINDEYNKAIRIYGYGYDSAFADFPQKISINQYNYLLKMLEDCKRTAIEFNKDKFLIYYIKILATAKNLISEDEIHEPDEVIIMNTEKNKIYIK